MNRLKTYPRTTMRDERLDRLMTPHVQKSRTETLEIIKVANAFASIEHRQTVFGTFSLSDHGNKTSAVLKNSTATQTKQKRNKKKIK